MVFIGRPTQRNLVSSVMSGAYFLGFPVRQDDIDQYYCAKIAHLEAGKCVTSDLHASIEEALQLDFSEQIQRLQRLFLDGDRDLEYWLQYMHKFGAKELVPKYGDLSWVEYYNADIWALCAIAVLICCFVCVKVIQTCDRKL